MFSKNTFLWLQELFSVEHMLSNARLTEMHDVSCSMASCLLLYMSNKVVNRANSVTANGDCGLQLKKQELLLKVIHVHAPKKEQTNIETDKTIALIVIAICLASWA